MIKCSLRFDQLYRDVSRIMENDLSYRVAADIISGPGRNLAKFSYGRRILPYFHASASLCNWAGIHCFTNSVICPLYFNGHVETM